MSSHKSDRLWWCWVKGWTGAKIQAERRRFQGNTFYYASQKAALHFGVDPHNIEAERIPKPKTSKKIADHDPWYWLKKDSEDESKRAKGSGGARKKGHKKSSSKKREKKSRSG